MKPTAFDPAPGPLEVGAEVTTVVPPAAAAVVPAALAEPESSPPQAATVRPRPTKSAKADELRRIRTGFLSLAVELCACQGALSQPTVVGWKCRPLAISRSERSRKPS